MRFLQKVSQFTVSMWVCVCVCIGARVYNIYYIYSMSEIESVMTVRGNQQGNYFC